MTPNILALFSLKKCDFNRVRNNLTPISPKIMMITGDKNKSRQISMQYYLHTGFIKKIIIYYLNVANFLRYKMLY